MIAAVLYPGGELRLEERAVPEPGPGQVRVRVGAVGICGSDLSYVKGTAKYPVLEPFVMGHEAAGVVEAVGSDVAVPVGTRVALTPGFSCGACGLCRSGRDNLCAEVRYLGSAATRPHVDGALQEFLVLPATNLVPLPAAVSLSTGALLEPLAVALHAVRRADVTGRTVLILGGGAIGQLLALAARTLSPAGVAVCDLVPRRRDQAVAHGADRGLDPAEAGELVAGGERFDVVFDATGHPAAVELGLAGTDPTHGRLVVVGNLPADYGLSAAAISRAEPWVTSTFRFPGGLAPALHFLVEHGLDLAWLVEDTATLAGVAAAFELARTTPAPLKIHVVP